MELRATIQDISSILPADSDQAAGNIQFATVSFTDTAGNPLIGMDGLQASALPITLVDAADQTIGVAAFTWQTSITSDSETYEILVHVDGFYDYAGSDSDITLITISKPLDDAVTGGGNFINSDSAGLYGGDPGKKTNFGFNIKTNKRGTNIQGNVNIIIRRDGRVYQIKTNSTESLSAVPTKDSGVSAAEFTAKANLKDITDPRNPISLGGNLQLLATVTDIESGSPDLVAFTLWDDATLLYSSHWTGTQTIEQALNGGNVRAQLVQPRYLQLDANTPLSDGAPAVSPVDLQSAVHDAIAAWSQTDISEEQLSRLKEISVRSTDLPERVLGLNPEMSSGLMRMQPDSDGTFLTPAGKSTCCQPLPTSLDTPSVLTMKPWEIACQLACATSNGCMNWNNVIMPTTKFTGPSTESPKYPPPSSISCCPIKNRKTATTTTKVSPMAVILQQTSCH